MKLSKSDMEEVINYFCNKYNKRQMAKELILSRLCIHAIIVAHKTEQFTKEMSRIFKLR